MASLEREGGLASPSWAGRENVSQRKQRGEIPVQGGKRSEPVSLRLGFAGEEFGYAIDPGLPTPSQSVFALDPEIKRESIWSGPFLRASNELIGRQGRRATRSSSKRPMASRA